ncbi:hypothetical protein BO78DRAFT_388001 [Aspergillus sclerotiicarbonarius CBS 121057]|uniref:Zn(II)2Cys6 transcription factor n=1 Tax=Aspergillus sclerotiicarbonarius (strain CBS 121057 / IBT 28362) TaxID=1448318 RepID=A0A319E4V8_ASPSB|nr:hypothetical protein BO78DRAFT_388001 [Aspergillus sclerotiicarbonarius CBS 121057]
MNHYSVATATSLFHQPDQQLWQRDVPTRAQFQPLLMHSLLAVAALHKAYAEPEAQRAEYCTRALQHHQAGLQLFQARLGHISTDQDSADLFTFSLLLVVWLYAWPALAPDRRDIDSDARLTRILGTLSLARGCKTILDLQMSSITSVPTGIQDALAQLRQRTADSVHLSAIAQLECLIGLAWRDRDDPRVAIAWPCLLEEEFWTQVAYRDPMALLILVHYAAFLQMYHRCWWLEGWADMILRAVDETIPEQDKIALDFNQVTTQISAEFQRVANLFEPETH